MPLPADTASPPAPALILALDRAEVLTDLLRLIFLAAESLDDQDGAAIARAALIAGDHLADIRTAVQSGLDDMTAA